MNLTDHYYILFITAFSSKLGDALFLLLSVFWNLVLWEIQSYSSSNLSKKAEYERLLKRINQTYWFSTHYRTFINNELTPTGFIIGKSGYIVYISEPNNSINSYNEEEQKFLITLYGWWSINQLLTDDIVCKEEGEYNVIRYYNSFVKIKDNYEMDHYHFNCHKASDLILKEYKKKNQCSVFLYGNPGLGKTTTARLLSKKLNATLCLDFEEFSHIRNSFVNSFELLYNYVQPTVQNPLIITIDELESFLLETNKGGDEYYGDRGERIQYRLKYKNIKKNWVRLMDTVQEKKFVVFVLTTNKTKEFFDELDPALLREYRINQCIHYTNDGVDMVPFQGKKKKKTI